uniref:Glycine-rich peptide n=1 Tax=Scytodes thoracica TaxID=1112478 RepID=A0A0A0V5E2_SCYTH|nr:glycine-rich peptide [Scytodes thoracica]
MRSLSFALVLMAYAIAMVMAAPKPFLGGVFPQFDSSLQGVDNVLHDGAQLIGLEPQQQYRQQGGPYY